MDRNNCTGTMPGMRLSPPAPLAPTWREWLRDGQRLVVTEFAHAWAVAVMWRSRARTRRDLACLDPRGLKDIGETPEQAAREARKPFWRA